MSDNPVITIITASLNTAKTIEATIASVAQNAIEQNYVIQHLVIDGGSQDGTLEICRAHASVTLIIVPGCSIYEAWNIGIEAAKAACIMFVNADDALLRGAVQDVTNIFSHHPEAAIVAGQARMVDTDFPDRPDLHMVAVPSGKLDVVQLALGVPVINAIAFRRSVFQKFGVFPTIYRAAGDRGFLLQLALEKQPPSVIRTPSIFYQYTCHNGSLTLRRNLKQRLLIAREHRALAIALLKRPISFRAACVLRWWWLRETLVMVVRSLMAGRV